jgi:hypothetical protein
MSSSVPTESISAFTLIAYPISREKLPRYVILIPPSAGEELGARGGKEACLLDLVIPAQAGIQAPSVIRAHLSEKLASLGSGFRRNDGWVVMFGAWRISRTKN